MTTLRKLMFMARQRAFLRLQMPATQLEVYDLRASTDMNVRFLGSGHRAHARGRDTIV
jgi:hypothetical protein